MTSIAKTRPTRLDRNALLVLDDARDATVAVQAGVVWLTLEKDTRDIVLQPGERFAIDRPGRTLLMAHTDATVQVARPARHVRVRRLVDAFAGAVRRALLAPRLRMLPYV